MNDVIHFSPLLERYRRPNAIIVVPRVGEKMTKPLSSPLDIAVENGITPGVGIPNRDDEKVEFAEVIAPSEDAPPDGGSKAWLQIVGSYCFTSIPGMWLDAEFQVSLG